VVADDYQSLEPKTPPALHYPGYPVYKNYPLVKCLFFFHLKLQASGASRLCQLFNPAMVFPLAAVKYYLFNLGFLGFFCDFRASPGRFIR
jgi:hypothetical protein